MRFPEASCEEVGSVKENYGGLYVWFRSGTETASSDRLGCWLAGLGLKEEGKELGMAGYLLHILLEF